MWFFLGGFLAMAGYLAAIGVTRNRRLSVRGWTALWTASSLAFSVILVVAFLLGGVLMEIMHGAATGYVVSVGVHTLHHFLKGTTRNPERNTSL